MITIIKVPDKKNENNNFNFNFKLNNDNKIFVIFKVRCMSILSIGENDKKSV